MTGTSSRELVPAAFCFLERKQLISRIMITRYCDYDLTRRNTFGMKVRCDRWIDYDSPDDLPAIFRELSGKWMHIGGGSNLLFIGDFHGTILHSSIRGVHADGTVVTVGAGEKLDDVVAWACSHGLWGLENLSAIPGEMGAAAVQNVGAYGVEISDLIIDIRVFDTLAGHFRVIPVEGAGYGYRHSMFKEPANKGRFIVVSLRLRLSDSPSPVLTHSGLSRFRDVDNLTPEAVRRGVIRVRDSKLPDPLAVGSAGSFFKNPVISADRGVCLLASYPDMPHYQVDVGWKIPAAWLIERAGMKDCAVGGASVWRRQPLVIVNSGGNAVPADIISLENEIIDAVLSHFGVMLSPEVEHI